MKPDPMMTIDAPSPDLSSRVDMSFVGNGTANEVFGGYLNAWSFEDHEACLWYGKFRKLVLDAVGQRYLPIYRMADGEFRFLMGRKINWKKRPFYRELGGYLGAVSGLRSSWRTSWGEHYSPSEVDVLRNKLIGLVRRIATEGFLAPYIYDNGIHAFEEYNSHVLPYLRRQRVELNAANYVPFHFPVTLLTDSDSRAFYEGRHILLATAFPPNDLLVAQETLFQLGASQVSYVETSADRALDDRIDISHVNSRVDVCLVAAGIGAANIVSQLEPLNTVTLDVGGFMRCLVDPTYKSHCVFQLPKEAV